MANTFEIKFQEENIPAKALMLIKKFTNQSISQIKHLADQHAPFFGCELSDDRGLSLIIKMHDEMESLNIETNLLEDGNTETINYFRNVLKSHIDTAKEVGLEEEDLDLYY